MTIRALIKILQGYNQNAEVLVVADRDKGDTCPASIVTELEKRSRPSFGFASVLNKNEDELKKKKKSKNVVIG